MTIKDLFENEELMDNMVEDIDDIPEDTPVTYEVWALGFTADDAITDAEVLLGEFSNPDEAVAFAEKVTVNQINEVGCEQPITNTAYFSVDVETVVEYNNDEESEMMNIGTIYTRDLWLDGEYGSEENVLAFEDPIVAVTTGDYELLDDGTLKLSDEFLKGFSKNDYIRIQFLDEPEADLMPYRIVSKVEYANGDYYHCELLI